MPRARVAAAKEGGRNRATVYEDGHRMAVADREARLALIHQCLDRHRWWCTTNRWSTWPPARRWRSKRSSGCRIRLAVCCLPARSSRIAEEAALDIRLGALVLEQALDDLARWSTMPPGEQLMVGVNVTARAAHPTRLRPPGAG